MKKDKMMQWVMMLTLLVTGLFVVSAQAVETIIYQDDFSDGTHDFISSYGALSVIDDTAGIGKGNALRFGPAGYGGCGALFDETTLASVGDSITLSLDVRWETTPVTGDKSLEDIRIGLFDDADNDRNMAEYDFWGFTNRIYQTLTPNAGRLYENGTQTVRVADTSGAFTAYNPQFAWGTTDAHHLVMTITRTETGVTTTVYADDALVCTRDSTPLLYTFDTVGIKLGDVTEAAVIDTVKVTFSDGPRTEAWDPLPADGQGLGTGDLLLPVTVDTVLSWQGPNVAEPNVVAGSVKYAVYMDSDLNKVESGIGCEYTSGAFSSNDFFDPTPDMDYLTQYYWRVDTQKQFDYKQDPNTFAGEIWTFKTENENTAPIVTAGQDLLTWSANAALGIQLTEPTLLDNEGDAAITWTADSTDVSFDDNTSLYPVVTITAVPAAGTSTVYTLTVTADDGANPASVDTMTITVASDACYASKINPLYIHVRNRGDYNDDCRVTLVDLADFAAEWLTDTSETADIWY